MRINVFVHKSAKNRKSFAVPSFNELILRVRPHQFNQVIHKQKRKKERKKKQNKTKQNKTKNKTKKKKKPIRCACRLNHDECDDVTLLLLNVHVY